MKLQELFSSAGSVVGTTRITHANSFGIRKDHGRVTFEHPVEAVKAISMFHGHSLLDKEMFVRMDKYAIEDFENSKNLPDENRKQMPSANFRKIPFEHDEIDYGPTDHESNCSEEEYKLKEVRYMDLSKKDGTYSDFLAFIPAIYSATYFLLFLAILFTLFYS